MEVTEIHKFFGILNQSLKVAISNLDSEILSARSFLRRKFDADKNALSPSERSTQYVSLNRAYQDACEALRPNCQKSGRPFSFSNEQMTQIRALNARYRKTPDTVEHNITTVIKHLTKRLLPEFLEDGEALPEIHLYFSYMKELLRLRWEGQLKYVPADDVLDLTLRSEECAALAHAFAELVRAAYDGHFISQEQFDYLIPCFNLTDKHGRVTKHFNFVEILFPNLERHYQMAKASCEAGTGFLWMPDKNDLQEDGTFLPTRLFTTAERKVLAATHCDSPQDNRLLLDGYDQYFVTSTDSRGVRYDEPAIMRTTFDKLWRSVEQALLIEYQVTEKTHKAEIIQQVSASVGVRVEHPNRAQIYAALIELQAEALEAYTAHFLVEYTEMRGWPGGAEERHRLENQIVCLKGTNTNSQMIDYTTLGNLFSMMSSGNLPSGTCVHTIWGRILSCLADYCPERRFDNESDGFSLIEMRFSEDLALARARARNRPLTLPSGSLSTLTSSCDNSVISEGARVAYDSSEGTSSEDVSVKSETQQDTVSESDAEDSQDESLSDVEDSQEKELPINGIPIERSCSLGFFSQPSSSRFTSDGSPISSSPPLSHMLAMEKHQKHTHDASRDEEGELKRSASHSVISTSF
ncbi:MAG: hypothetical protein P1U61_07705 [Legionellaceae bacterium]|nr:hypothetical protein [Legionellaceae bacterium]